MCDLLHASDSDFLRRFRLYYGNTKRNLKIHETTRIFATPNFTYRATMGAAEVWIFNTASLRSRLA